MHHNLEMRNRRFVLLAAVLVALNTALWIVPQGLALRQVVVSSLFGKRMVRADVTEANGCPTNCVEWRVARGIVQSNGGGVLTVQEADTKIEAIKVSAATTRVTSAGVIIKLKAVKPGWTVLVTWPAPNGTADAIVVERRALPTASSRR